MNFKDYLRIEVYENKYQSLIKKIYLRYFFPNTNAVFLIRRILTSKGIKRIFYRLRLIHKYGIFIGKHTEIDAGLQLPHPNGIIIGDYVKIGGNCTIYQQVTIGVAGLDNISAKSYPNIGDNCILFSGAKILGDIKLSNNTVVGANSVLLMNTEKNSIYAGIPAKRK